jgi:NAD(P)-dependent dehydrogenase (short-subunit alcohol dehydrogenase family)
MAKKKAFTPYNERSILVFGGASGIGLEAVTELKKLGTRNIYIGTSHLENFDKALQILKRNGVSDVSSGIYPFHADVQNKSELQKAAKEVKKIGSLTDVIFSHAGGMEGFTGKLLREYLIPIARDTGGKSLYDLDKKTQELVKEKMKVMRENIEVWAKESIPHGISINYEGTFNAIDVFGEEFPDGYTGVFYNSTWGKLSGVKDVEIPLLYRPVDVSKGMTRDRLQKEGTQLAQKGIYMSEIVASLVNDTRVGKMFNTLLIPLLLPEQQEAIKASSVTAKDVVTATRKILESDPSVWGNYPEVLYVYTQNKKVIFESKLELSSMYTIPYPF